MIRSLFTPIPRRPNTVSLAAWRRQGWHTAAITMRLQVESAPIGGRHDRRQRGTDLAPADPARRHAACGKRNMEVTPSRSKPDRGFITLKSETLNQRGEVVQLQTSKLAGLAAPNTVLTLLTLRLMAVTLRY